MTKTLILLIILSTFLYAGCNILSWTHDNDNIQDKLSDAKYEMEKGNYEEAKELFEEVLAEDSDNSEAIWGIAKANFALKVTIGDIVQIAKRLDGNQYKEGTQLLSPQDFSFDDWGQVVNFLDNDIIYYLNKLFSEETDGAISPRNVALNFSASIMYFLSSVTYLLDSPITVVDEQGNQTQAFLEISWKKDDDTNPDIAGTGSWDVRFPKNSNISILEIDPQSPPFPETINRIHKGVSKMVDAIEYTDVSNKDTLIELRDVLETIELDIAFLDFAD